MAKHQIVKRLILEEAKAQIDIKRETPGLVDVYSEWDLHLKRVDRFCKRVSFKFTVIFFVKIVVDIRMKIYSLFSVKKKSNKSVVNRRVL